MEAVYTHPHQNLVLACKKGSRNAQSELYKLYSKGMFNVAMRIVNDAAEAADVLQEAFLDGFLRIHDFRQETTFGLWIRQIVINKAIDHLRKCRATFIALEEGDVGNLAEEDPVDEEELQYKVEQVRKAIQLLPDGYRIVLSLYLLEGYDHEEIAHILGISENTSRSQFLRAKRKLTAILKDRGISND